MNLFYSVIIRKLSSNMSWWKKCSLSKSTCIIVVQFGLLNLIMLFHWNILATKRYDPTTTYRLLCCQQEFGLRRVLKKKKEDMLIELRFSITRQICMVVGQRAFPFCSLSFMKRKHHKNQPNCHFWHYKFLRISVHNLLNILGSGRATFRLPLNFLETVK